jgi:lysophospholipase L1-like esterase
MFIDIKTWEIENIRNYVAIGDSLSEGLGDFAFDWHLNREGCGWTDRLATMLTQQAQERGEDFRYANFAIRGSKSNT